jgi:cation diffusion facilitator CzcD-associated flavoprotein CzcO
MVKNEGATTEVAVIGAGPYGLSLAAHLRHRGVPFRIFGNPMHSWRKRMPEGMCLKSDGFASNLSDPESTFTLGRFSAERGLPYADVGYPIPIETFIAYGLEFQKRLVPDLEETDITQLQQDDQGYLLQTTHGDALHAKKVVVAAGITHFAYLPPVLAGLPAEYVTHSSEHRDTNAFRQKSVAIIGAGASAVDLAALLQERGAEVHLVARRSTVDFHQPPGKEPRPWLDRLLNPRSGLGLGWRSRLCTDAPLLFHAMPARLRLRAVRRHLGPAPGWFVRDKVVGKVPLHLGVALSRPVIQGDRVQVHYRRQDSSEGSLPVHHVIGGTGYRVSLEKLTFLDPKLRERVRHIEGSPVLSRQFESTAPGLYFVGVASANSFGPMARFAYGAEFTARRLGRHLSRRE